MPESLKKLINTISYLPGIGEKSATKLAFFLLNANENFLESFAKSLSTISKDIDSCKNCFALIDVGREYCSVCSDNTRDSNLICVVEEYLDYLTIEHAGGFEGKYHMLGGAISPLNGIYSSDLKIKDLIQRVSKLDGNVELILATNPNLEGEATNAFIIEQIKEKELQYRVKVTKLSRGLSSGYIEYADNLTIISSLRERKEV